MKKINNNSFDTHKHNEIKNPNKSIVDVQNKDLDKINTKIIYKNE